MAGSLAVHSRPIPPPPWPRFAPPFSLDTTLKIPTRPIARTTAGHDIALAIGRAARGQVVALDGGLHQPVEDLRA